MYSEIEKSKLRLSSEIARVGTYISPEFYVAAMGGGAYRAGVRRWIPDKVADKQHFTISSSVGDAKIQLSSYSGSYIGDSVMIGSNMITTVSNPAGANDPHDFPPEFGSHFTRIFLISVENFFLSSVGLDIAGNNIYCITIHRKHTVGVSLAEGCTGSVSLRFILSNLQRSKLVTAELLMERESPLQSAVDITAYSTTLLADTNCWKVEQRVTSSAYNVVTFLLRMEGRKEPLPQTGTRVYNTAMACVRYRGVCDNERNLRKSSNGGANYKLETILHGTGRREPLGRKLKSHHGDRERQTRGAAAKQHGAYIRPERITSVARGHIITC
ncbi:hypothetical protein EVAR_92454_1 [Eumeta japonica]|uniref:Uncharacterized protein n=1 Tax=Eumeta variegata TaxID=151549 RepID=A0A4C1T9D9_EUMVA|nr:hypothetical protein EVAR_92454_1 [Eumeta japonica]